MIFLIAPIHIVQNKLLTTGRKPNATIGMGQNKTIKTTIITQI
jgi:hypothetical protein